MLRSRLIFPILVLTSVACSAAKPDTVAKGEDAVVQAPEPDAITLASFQSHPAILEITAITEEVNEKLWSAGFDHVGDEDACDDGGWDYRTRLVDSAGVTRRYEVYTGNLQPLTKLTRVDYDAAGTLRYVMQRGDAAGGGELHQAAFFDASGKKIFEVTKALPADADNDTFASIPFTLPQPGTELDVEALRDPAAALAVPLACTASPTR